MPADSNNPAGYWESAVFCELHERLLRRAGTRWDGFTRLEPDRLHTVTMNGLNDECISALRAEFGDATPFVLKDPRMCRFVPFWLHILDTERIEPAVILVLRSPAAVARSLTARDGLEPDVAMLIWLRHVLDAERETRGVRRTFVRYRDVLDRWTPVAGRISRDLQVSWSVRSASDDAAIDRFIRRSLSHHDGHCDPPPVSPALFDWVHEAWSALERLHDGNPGGTAEAFAVLDTIREDFDRNTSVLGDIRDRIHEGVRAHLDGALAEVERLRDHIDGLERERQALHLEQQALRGQVTGLEALRADFERRIAALERQTTVVQQELAAARFTVEALRKSASWRVTAPLRAVYRIFR